MVARPPRQNSRKFQFIKRDTLFEGDNFLEGFLSKAKEIRDEMKEFNIPHVSETQAPHQPTPSIKKAKTKEKILG